MLNQWSLRDSKISSFTHTCTRTTKFHGNVSRCSPVCAYASNLSKCQHRASLHLYLCYNVHVLLAINVKSIVSKFHVALISFASARNTRNRRAPVKISLVNGSITSKGFLGSLIMQLQCSRTPSINDDKKFTVEEAKIFTE